MLIRKADLGDLDDVLEWKNDPHSKKMFFDGSTVRIEDHRVWYLKSLSSNTQELFIGESGGRKIGICRFDLDLTENTAEVSINLNPAERGKGLSIRLLSGSINEFTSTHDVDLLSRIKRENVASVKIFETAGFVKTMAGGLAFTYLMPKTKLTFRKVQPDTGHAGILYDFLSKRTHSISHTNMPSLDEHNAFVQSNPYLHWYMIYEAEDPIGSFYVQSDNSIGVNLLQVKNDWVSQIIRFVVDEFTPMKSIPSKIPPYFYLNTAFNNEDMVKALAELNVQPIQISHRIN